LLLKYLSDPLVPVRLVGLDLVRAMLLDSRTPAPEACARVRELLNAPEPAVRASAARTIVGLREPADAERFRQALSTDKNREVQLAMVNGLGYLGTLETIDTLMGLARHRDSAIANEAVRALGRLAERGVLADQASRRRVADLLLERFEQIAKDDFAGREPILRAMARVYDARFAQVFAAALTPPAPAAVREAAAAGLAALADSLATQESATQPAMSSLTPAWLRETLAPAASDDAPGVRRTAVSVLAAIGESDQDLQALWSRASPAVEPEEAVRKEAWTGILRILDMRGAAEVEQWLEKLPAEALSTGSLEGAVALHRLLV
jgi:HEAT repeat protein